MRRCVLVLLFALACVAMGMNAPAQNRREKLEKQVEPIPRGQWIWYDEGDPARGVPAATRYFRKVFKIDRPVQKVVDEATLDITADSKFTVWINGALVGSGNNWRHLYQFDVQKLMVHGDNCVAVRAKNNGAAAGFVVRLAYVPNGMTRMARVSDGSWKAAN